MKQIVMYRKVKSFMLTALLMAGVSAQGQVCQPSASAIEGGTILNDGELPGYSPAKRTPKSANPMAAARRAASASEPFFEDFLTPESMDGFTVVNVNDDNKTWKHNSGWHCAACEISYANGNDDWLITPAISLSGGKVYSITFRARIDDDSTPFTIWAGLGIEPTVEAMTQEVAAESVLQQNSSRYLTYGSDVIIPADGDYYLGIHAKGDPGNWGYSIKVDSILVSISSLPQAPDSVTNLTLTPGERGAMEATISFDAPLNAIDGTPLTDISRIELLRNGQLVATRSDVAPGEHVAMTDGEVSDVGMNTYTVIPYNSYDFGREAQVSGYIGMDAPLAPSNARFIDREQSIALAWDAVGDTGRNGGYVDADEVSYVISSIYGEPIDTIRHATEREWVMDADEGPQGYLEFLLNAFNEQGQSPYVYTSPIILGAPYELPLHDSFAVGDGGLAHLWWTTDEGSGSFRYVNDAADDEGGHMQFYPYSAGTVATVNTGKLSLANQENVAIAFNHLARPGVNAHLRVKALRPDGTTDTLRDIDYATLEGEARWLTEKVPLEGYDQERYVIVRFEVQSESTYIPFGIDNVNIRSLAPCDLAATATAPVKVTKGKSCPVAVRVMNYGDSDIQEYTINLYDGDQLADSRTVSRDLASFAAATDTLIYSPSILREEDMAWLRAEVVADGDADADNDFADLEMELITPLAPPATNLTATRTAEGVTLAWQQPENLAMTLTETFDDYDPWLIDGVGEWTMIDGDRTLNVSFLSDAQYPHQWEPFAFIVFNPELLSTGLGSEDYVSPHSGQQYLAATQGYDPTNYSYLDCDNWLISPRLSGRSQTISFFTKDMWQAEETFEVLYSTTGNSRDDFVKTGETLSNTTGQWQESQVELPEGATYFAIRHTTPSTTYSYFFMLDDITFEATAGTIAGYQVYRDGQPLAFVADAEAYTDVEASMDHDYAVTVVYANGMESVPVRLGYAATGIQAIDGHSIEHSTLNIDRSTAVYDLQGRRVASMANGQSNKGIYIQNGRKHVVR